MSETPAQPALDPEMHERVCSWFIGPHAENFDALQTIFAGVLKDHRQARLTHFPDDGPFYTKRIMESTNFKNSVDELQGYVQEISNDLNLRSVPFYTPRYAGHMSWETSLPAIAGWIAGILHNQNNVAFEASPLTTTLELKVGEDLCHMFGYDKNSWGHIASDGTLANMESMWAARNLKFYPLSVHTALLRGPLKFISSDYSVVPAGSSEPKLFVDLDPWQLLNLPTRTILGIGDDLRRRYGITSEFLASALSPYLIQSRGKEGFLDAYKIKNAPQYLITSTKHYSWPKSAALVGIGSENCVRIPVDFDARVKIDALRALLQARLDEKQAVYGVVAVIGSTEEGAVDPLDDIIKLRDEFSAKGLTFIVHADAAWGGYFASMIRDPPPILRGPIGDEYVPSITMRDYCVKQFDALKNADSITVDPHKAGYVPYPAGGLCYQDGRMRYLLTWTAPYLHDDTKDESVGIYGIEGSKPGAPAIATHLHHKVVGLHKKGHGGLLGEVAFACRRISAHWAAMSDDTTPFIVVPFNKYVNEQQGPDAIAKEKEFIRANILPATNEKILADPKVLAELCALGSDLNINVFACNFRINGVTNTDVEEANYLNQCIFAEFSVTDNDTAPSTMKLFLSATVFDHEDYGDCADEFKRRLGLETASKQPLFVLRNVVMSPFQAANGFVRTLAEVFQTRLEEKVQNAISRNTVSPQTHEFTMQGTDKLFLAYRPVFNHVNGRQQLILSVGAVDLAAWERYVEAVSRHPGEIYTLRTSTQTTLDDIVKNADRGFTGDILGPQDIEAAHSSVRDADYPDAWTPFYLYGTEGQHHVDHMLLRAPNTQISSARVLLDVGSNVDPDQLARGVIARIGIPERALQPIGTDHPFTPRRRFHVAIYADDHDAEAQGPGLSSGSRLLVEGSLEIGDGVYTRAMKVNDEQSQLAYLATGPSRKIKSEWAQDILTRLRA
ncbi:PLP-dependent transferase [Schizophyllum commune H4-8]|uniref:PLP-dependent transferase n=1 Tax=Schizophyllum commune (strain H4-8 / FGSC 9210) TaxID=578458 RepID=UPI00215DDCF4|nr:PLP-dependent transferase [Schizophyllum commune H4-8]KAI5888048.1 PLP-dependent transferase [Schizophyllum commune H4-8]